MFYDEDAASGRLRGAIITPRNARTNPTVFIHTWVHVSSRLLSRELHSIQLKWMPIRSAAWVLLRAEPWSLGISPGCGFLSPLIDTGVTFNQDLLKFAAWRGQVDFGN